MFVIDLGFYFVFFVHISSWALCVPLASCLFNAQPPLAHRPAADDNSLIDKAMT